MAAHVHRYKAEMEVIKEVVSDLAIKYTEFCAANKCNLESRTTACDHLSSFALVASNITALRKFMDELEKKTQTVIALV